MKKAHEQVDVTRRLQNQIATLEYENKDLNEKRLRHEGKIRNLQEDIKRSEIDCQRLNDELQAYRRETEMVVEQRQELDASRRSRKAPR